MRPAVRPEAHVHFRFGMRVPAALATQTAQVRVLSTAELVATELVATELVATELVATELVATELVAKELVAKELSELSAGALVRAAAMELTAAMAAPAGGMV